MSLDERFKSTQFVVEATGYEEQVLWEQFSCEYPYERTEFNTLEWKQDAAGCVVDVGSFHGCPVNICCRWAWINGVLVMFWEAISDVVKYSMIEDWLMRNCAPRWDNDERVAHTNATNFHHVLHYIREREENESAC